MAGLRKSRAAKARRLTITLGGDQRRQIESIAKERRTSAATVIRWAVDDYLSAHNASAAHPEAEKE